MKKDKHILIYELIINQIKKFSKSIIIKELIIYYYSNFIHFIYTIFQLFSIINTKN